jgi:hypothetical protein
MAHTTGHFADLLWPGLFRIYGDSYRDWPALYTQIFEIASSDKTYEKVQGVNGFSYAYPKDQMGQISYVQTNQGFPKEFVHEVYGIGAIVSKEMYTDDQYRYINTFPKLLARSMRLTEEVLAWNIINRAFNANYTGADGKPLISDSHPRSGTGGGTYSNTLATAADLDQTSFETMVQVVMDMTDNEGMKIMLKPKKLIVPTALWATSSKLLDTNKVVGSADNDSNPLIGLGINSLVVPYLTDSDAWFLTTDQGDGLIWFWRWRTEAFRDGDFDTQNLKFATTARHSQGWIDPRCIVGTAGA